MCFGAQRARRLQRLPKEKPGEHQGYTAESLLGNTARASLRRDRAALVSSRSQASMESNLLRIVRQNSDFGGDLIQLLGLEMGK